MTHEELKNRCVKGWNNGDLPAMAFSYKSSPTDHEIFHGLTKREQFAAMAMQGLLTSAQNTIDRGFIIKNSVDYADKLLAELAKEKL